MTLAKPSKLVWRCGVLLGCIYIGYLHIKIGLYKEALEDASLAFAETHLLYRRIIGGKKDTAMDEFWEERLISMWRTLDTGELRTHPGRGIWKYRIAEALKAEGKREDLYPEELKTSIRTLGKQPVEENEYHFPWNHLLYSWWP